VEVSVKMSTTKGIRFFQMVFLSVGLMTVAFGMYATDSRLVEWAVLYVKRSPGMLSAESVALLHRLRIWTIVGGLVVAASSAGLGYLDAYITRVKDRLASKVDPVAVAERVVLRLGVWSSRAFTFVTDERVLWSMLALILCTIPVAIFFLRSAGVHGDGIDLQPAKNLVRHGIYGTLTTHGFDNLTFQSTAGPGIILPRALAFWLFGINPFNSRMVGLAFVIATVLVFHRFSLRVYEKSTAWLGTFLVIPQILAASTGIGPEGYIVGFLYFMIGSLFWFKAVERGRSQGLLMAGLFWGLAFQTKWFFLFVLPALIVTWMILRFSKNPLGHRHYFLPALGIFGVTAAWTAFRIWDVGMRQELIHINDFWNAHWHRAIGFEAMNGLGGGVAAFRPIVTLMQVDIWGELQLFLIIPAVIYAAFLILRGKLADYRSLLILVFGLVWFSWWFLLNYDLSQLHLHTVLFIAQLFNAKLFCDAWNTPRDYRKRFLDLIRSDASPGEIWAYLARVAIVCIVLFEVIPPLISRASDIYPRYQEVGKPYLEMSVYLRAQTEKNAVVSGWTWSLPWSLDLDDEVDHVVKDRSTYPLEQREDVPEYFIVSPEWPLEKKSDSWPMVAGDNEWNRKNNEVRKKFVSENCVLIKTFGGPVHQWIVYKVKNDKLDSPPPIVPSGA
jgi:Dolichyl-phosphate-mannose-protein mannosyltransferase